MDIGNKGQTEDSPQTGAEASDDAGIPFGLEAIAACVAPLSMAKPAI